MFTCNNIYLLTFTYYLKYVLAFNIVIIPSIYLYLNIINMIKKKITLNKWYIKRRLKTIYYILTIVILSLITHNMLTDNICYVNATPKTYHQYKDSYNFLKNKDIDSDIKNDYLNNILTNKDNPILTNTIYKQANIINDNKEEKEENKQESIIQDNFLNETDYNVQNKVYVENGVFFYPAYKYGIYNTYSGTNCPSDPLNQGYNNPYGYNNYFYNRLTKFINEANNNGYKITLSTGGCRTFNTQSYYYRTMTPGRAAKPGLSLHGHGIASDLEFYNTDGSVCSGYRTDTSCPSMGWAHNNANRFGLTFPLLNASYREDWHIEPINKVKY